MATEIIKSITNIPSSLGDKIRLKIRERAIENAKITILLAERDINTFSEEELEIVIADEERKVIDKIKSMSFFAILAFFGLSLF